MEIKRAAEVQRCFVVNQEVLEILVKAPTLALLFAIFSLSLVASSILVPLLRKVALRYSIVDRPNQPHKTHQETIPYLGGFAIIFPVSLLAIIGPVIFIESAEYKIRTLLILAPAIIMSIVGLYDDIKSLSAQSRFILQTVMAIVVTIYLKQLGFTVLVTDSNLLNFLLSMLWLVGITNAFNFFDNLDGGAAGITVISSLTLAVLSYVGEQYLIASFSLTLAGAGLGFLWWNRSPARIYLGDSGALFIGLMLSVALLQFEPNVDSRFASALLPVFILALPIIDTSVVVASRISRGVSIFQGGRDHLSHRLLEAGFSRRVTATLLWVMGGFFSILSLLISAVSKEIGFTMSLVGLAIMGFLFVKFLKRNI